MLLEKVDAKFNVSNFCIDNNGLTIWANNKLSHNNNLLFNKEINTVYYFNKSCLVITNNFEDSILINKDHITSKFCAGINGMSLFFDESTILYNKWNEDCTISFNQKIDLTNDKILWEHETLFGKPIILDNMLFGSNNSSLFRIDADTGSPIWENKLEEYGYYSVNGENRNMDVQKYIGVLNSILYVKLGNRIIAGYKVDNGREVFQHIYNDETLALDNLQLDKTNHAVFSIGPSAYFELDINTAKSNLLDLKTETTTKSINLTRLGSWVKNIVFFWEGSTNNKFGVFDRISKRILNTWTLDVVKGRFPAIMNVEHYENKVYVTDGNYTMHIFEIM